MKIHTAVTIRKLAIILPVWILFCCMAAFGSPARAITWIGGDGYWNWQTAWEGWRFPAEGDDVWIVDNWISGPKTVIYVNPHYPNTPTLNILYINSLWGLPTTVKQGQDVLRVNWEEIGSDGQGRFIQLGGLHEVNEALYLGHKESAAGWYELHQGASLHTYGTEYVGSGGSGAFNQHGGTHRVADGLYLAWFDNAVGTYRLNGGTLDTDESVIGYRGLGDFYQYAGSIHTTEKLNLAQLKDAEGSYALSGGQLVTGEVSIGNRGIGVFDQTGGIHQVNNDLYIGRESNSTGWYSTGWYYQDGGDLRVNYDTYVGYHGRGYFRLDSGNHRVGKDLYLGYSTGAWGHYNIEGGELVTGDTYVGYNGRGFMDLYSGEHLVNNTLYLGYFPGANGSYDISYRGSLITGNTIIGYHGGGRFWQRGGAHTVRNSLYVNGYPLGAGDAYSLIDGVLSTTSEFIGHSEGASFSQSGGEHKVKDTLSIGYTGLSSYKLRNGRLTVGDEYLGLDGGSAEFSHQWGTHDVANTLYLGNDGTADYHLTEDRLPVSNDDLPSSLTVGAEIIGNNPGSNGGFLQDAGAHEVKRSLTLGRMRNIGQGAATGAYELRDGSLSVGVDETIGDGGVGFFTHSGGTHTVGYNVFLGYGSQGTGEYNLSGTGVFEAALYEYIGFQGRGVFRQSGGTHSVSGLFLGVFPGSNGVFELSGTGQLDAGDETIGYGGTGTFTQTGGTHTADNLTIGPGSDSGSKLDGSGTYMMDGGQLDVAGLLKVGANGSMTIKTGLVKVDALEIHDAGSFEFLGGSLMAEGLQGDLINAGGRLAPGASPGILTIAGDYTQLAGGILEIELGGLLRGTEYDVLDVNGALSLDGTLDVVWWNNFSAAAGDSFDILDWVLISGGFDDIRLPGLATGLAWDISSLYVDGVLAVSDSPVPIPGAVWLLGSGLFGLAALRRRVNRG